MKSFQYLTFTTNQRRKKPMSFGSIFFPPVASNKCWSWATGVEFSASIVILEGWCFIRTGLIFVGNPQQNTTPGKKFKGHSYQPWKKKLSHWKKIKHSTGTWLEGGWGEGLHSQNMLHDSLAVHRIFGAVGSEKFENGRIKTIQDI